jgi:hypothetical protein
MHKGTAVRGAAVVALLVAGVARAQHGGASGPQWTVDSGETVGNGENVFRAQAGYPGIWLDFLHGINSTWDIGGRFGFNYSFQGALGFGDTAAGCNVGFVSCPSYLGSGVGLNFQALIRTTIGEIGHYKIALTFDPGLMLYFPSSALFNTSAIAGIMFPIGAQMGFPVNQKLVFNASFELPLFATFSDGASGSNYGGAFFIPILFGGGVEYFLQPNLSLTFKLALGVTITTNAPPTISSAAFTLQTMGGIAYRFR